MEKNVVKEEVKNELVISNEDFEKYFNKREWITKEEYCNYLKLKGQDFNAIFNATPIKSYKNI